VLASRAACDRIGDDAMTRQGRSIRESGGNPASASAPSRGLGTACAEMSSWMAEGKLRSFENVAFGDVDNFPETLMRLWRNTSKLLLERWGRANPDPASVRSRGERADEPRSGRLAGRTGLHPKQLILSDHDKRSWG
jgi:hypothetical protein